MGYASAFSECGCSHTMIMESGVMIHYVRCADHYVASIDDPKIIEAAENKREHDQKMWDDVNNMWDKGVEK